MSTKASPGEHKATATTKMLRDTPANNLDAEKTVLGSMALKESSRDYAVAKLSPEDFYSQPHRDIFKALAKLHSTGAAVDMVTIADMLRKATKLEACGGPAYLGELLESVASATASRASVGIVLECAHRRRLADAGLKLIDCAYDLGTDPVEASANVQAMLDTASGQREESTSQAPSEYLNDYMANLEALQAGKGVVGIPTPFESLNYYISGLTPGEVIILAGRAGTGKTALALNIAWYAAAQGYPVGIVSMEMIKFALTNRLFAANAMVDAQKFRTGHFSSVDWDSMYAFADTLNRAPLKICDKSFLRPSELRAICRDWKKNFGLSLLVIDYLQLLQPETRSNNREREVADISRMIKIIAVELEIPIIVLAQLNREAEKEKHPKLTHLRESGSLEQDADIVLFITPWKNSDAQEDHVTVTMDVAKGRSNAVGKFDLLYRRKYLRFENLNRVDG
ncbi:replicative DNA helicase [Solidesulfovibrio sp.]